MEKRWKILKADEDAVNSLSKSLNGHKELCTILVQRGITTYNEAEHFFNPDLKHLHDPFLMKDMEKAVARIILAIEKKEKILVFGDYDVDGTTAVTSMYS